VEDAPTAPLASTAQLKPLHAQGALLGMLLLQQAPHPARYVRRDPTIQTLANPRALNAVPVITQKRQA